MSESDLFGYLAQNACAALASSNSPAGGDKVELELPMQ